MRSRLYAPRPQLHNALPASDGRVLREGGANLVDLPYRRRAVSDTTGPQRYDGRRFRESQYCRFANEG